MLSCNEETKWQSMKWKAENSHITVSYFRLYWSEDFSRIQKSFHVIKTMRTPIVIQDKFIYKLLKGTEILKPWDTHQSLSRRKIPQQHAKWHIFCRSFVLSLELWLAVIAKINYQMKRTGGLIKDGSSHVPSYHSSIWKQRTCVLLQDRKARKQELVRQMPSYHWHQIIHLLSWIYRAPF